MGENSKEELGLHVYERIRPDAMQDVEQSKLRHFQHSSRVLLSSCILVPLH